MNQLSLGHQILLERELDEGEDVRWDSLKLDGSLAVAWMCRVRRS